MRDPQTERQHDLLADAIYAESAYLSSEDPALNDPLTGETRRDRLSVFAKGVVLLVAGLVLAILALALGDGWRFLLLPAVASTAIGVLVVVFFGIGRLLGR